jgi:putative oxidoreductase
MVGDLSDFGLLVLRVFVGLLLAGHGVQKLFGWFGGSGIAGFSGSLGKMGLRLPRLWAWVAALVETLGGLLVALGVLTPVAAGFLISNLVMAIIKVHWRNGFWNTKGGSEFALTLIAALFALALVGPGAYAVGPQTLAGWTAPAIFAGSLLVGMLGVILGLVTGAPPLSRQPQHS